MLKRRMASKVAGLLFVALTVSLSAAPARAIPIIDFLIPGGTGTVSYPGGSSPLTGSSIGVSGVTGFGTPQNPGTTLAITGGVLSFTTGAFAGSTSTSWTFGPGGSISITGGIPSLGIPSGTTLLSGLFTDPATVLNAGGGIFKIIGATLGDFKHPSITTFFGLPAVGYIGALNLSLVTFPGVNPPSAFTSSSVGSGDVSNFVPEPASLLLLGSGLLGLAALGRRRLKGVGRSEE